MNFELEHLFFAGVLYLLVLFFIAYATEQGWVPARITHHPATYALSLGVYATSWSFYGSVGFAQSAGFSFLSIYLGVTLAFLLVPVLLAPLLRIARDYQLTSLADVLAFRYRSQLAGVLVTLFMLAGTFPYIALQILAVTESIQILTREATPWVLALGFCVTLTLFAILFGARHVSARENHEGLVVAIAFESLVKLFALLSVGLFALFGVFGGFGGLDRWLAAHPEALSALYRPVREGPWTTLLLLSFCAAFLLPRQFHMTFVENNEERSLHAASWGFPLFLLLLNLGIPIILWAGMKLAPATSPDYYVLGITLSGESRLLSALAFIGGLSAASAMVIVTTIALASMCLNHLVLPATYPDPEVDIYKWLLWRRRVLILAIVLLGYGFYLVLEKNQALVQLGLISFVAVAQFLPGVLGVLYWSRATRAGFIAGLLGGGTVWALTLLPPLLVHSGIVGESLARFSLLPIPGVDRWFFSTATSLAVNGVLFLCVSLLTRPGREEQDAAEACRPTALMRPGGVLLSAASPADFKDHLARILGPDAAEMEVSRALRDLDLSSEESNPNQLRRLREQIERNLSGLMGPMLSRMIVDDRLQMDPSAQTALADNIRFIEERVDQSQTELQGVAAELDSLRRYHQQVLRDLPLGACAVGRDRHILSWNLAMEVLSGIERAAARGKSVGHLPAPWSRLIDDCLSAADQHLHKVRAVVDGRVRWFNLHKAVIEDPTAPEQVGGSVILVEDLTDLHNLESELDHSERLASIGRLAAGVAHEIGNPVTGIACLAQNLQSETRDPESRSVSRQIIHQAARINEIVQSLVGFSHGGHATQTIARLRLRACVAEAIRLVGLSHAARHVHFHNRCSDSIEILGDRTRLLQVFVNLLSNACDATHGGDEIVVAASAQRTEVTVTVTDGGDGIPPDILAHVFEPFVTSKPPGRGTGLGLSIVYRIVKDHRGQIAIDSTVGEGTTVSMTLPGGDGNAGTSTRDERVRP